MISLLTGLLRCVGPGRRGCGDRRSRRQSAMRVERVGGPVPAAVEAVSVGLAAGGGDRCGAAEVGEGGFGAQPVGVVAGGDQQLPGDVGPTPTQGGSMPGAVAATSGRGVVEVGDLGGELLMAAGQPSAAPRWRWAGSAVAVGAQRGAGHQASVASSGRAARSGAVTSRALIWLIACGAGLDRAAAGHPQGRMASTGPSGSWGCRCGPGQGGPGGGVGVDRVGLAPGGGSCGRAGRPRSPRPRRCAVAGQAGPIGAGALHPDPRRPKPAASQQRRSRLGWPGTDSIPSCRPRRRAPRRGGPRCGCHPPGHHRQMLPHRRVTLPATKLFTRSC